MAIPTIKKIINDGGSVVLMSHLGRPKDAPSPEFSLKQIVGSLESLLERKIIFISDCISDSSLETTKNLENGSVVLLENLRFYKEEEKNDTNFSKHLSFRTLLCQYWINVTTNLVVTLQLIWP